LTANPVSTCHGEIRELTVGKNVLEKPGFSAILNRSEGRAEKLRYTSDRSSKMNQNRKLLIYEWDTKGVRPLGTLDPSFSQTKSAAARVSFVWTVREGRRFPGFRRD
jgi:hypothetical protein